MAVASKTPMKVPALRRAALAKTEPKSGFIITATDKGIQYEWFPGTTCSTKSASNMHKANRKAEVITSCPRVSRSFIVSIEGRFRKDQDCFASRRLRNG